MAKYLEPKAPTGVKDYGIDWTLDLDTGETLASSAFAIVGSDVDIVVDSDSFDDDSTTVWLSGGTGGLEYLLRNTVTTNSSPVRTMVREFAVPVLNI